MSALIRMVSLAVLGTMMAAPASHAADLDRTVVEFKTPAELKWVKNAAGTNESVVLFGDPAKPGPYVVRIKWLAGNMSRPHFHPNDRFITVLKGTWWVASGNKVDKENMVPMRAGTFVTHFGKQVHWDGAKDEEAWVLIVGEGPATSTPVEEAKN